MELTIVMEVTAEDSYFVLVESSDLPTGVGFVIF